MGGLFGSQKFFWDTMEFFVLNGGGALYGGLDKISCESGD